MDYSLSVIGYPKMFMVGLIRGELTRYFVENRRNAYARFGLRHGPRRWCLRGFFCALINSRVNLLHIVNNNNIILLKGVMIVPNIKPISDLRNYTEVLKEVDVSSRVYLTRNGHGEYGILTMNEIDELDRYRAAYELLSKLQSAEERAELEGWIDSTEIEKELGV